MHSGRNSRGYTIVEVMIFLAVSGMMFIVASNFISGKQAEVEFTRSTTSIDSQITTVINNVSTGYYPSTQSFSCSATSSGPDFNSVLRKGQGTNGECIFLGDVVQFLPTDTSDKNSTYYVIPVAGNRLVQDNSGLAATSFEEAKPRAMSSAPANMVSTERLLYGMTASGMYVKSGGYNRPISAIGFFSTLGSYENSILQSSARNVHVVGIPGDSRYGMSLADMSNRIRNVRDSDILTDPVILCLVGGNGKHASVTIGQQGGGLTVNTEKGKNIQTVCK